MEEGRVGVGGRLGGRQGWEIEMEGVYQQIVEIQIHITDGQYQIQKIWMKQHVNRKQYS